MRRKKTITVRRFWGDEGKCGSRVVCRQAVRAEAMRRKKKRLDKGTEARRRARVIGLAPQGTRVIADKRKKAEKHKKSGAEWLAAVRAEED